jgi:prepilin-type N-terminal cleavage/methylation domain-containing protein
MKKREGFTLIEMMISISILSLLMLFLYQSYAQLNKSNTQVQQSVTSLEDFETIKRILYLDLSLAHTITIIPQDKENDVVFLQTTNSIHGRFHPYVAYIYKENFLYRLESLAPFKEYPFGADVDFDVDKLAQIQHLRLYKSKADPSYVLLDIELTKRKKILFKTKALNLN